MALSATAIAIAIAIATAIATAIAITSCYRCINGAIARSFTSCPDRGIKVCRGMLTERGR